MSFVGRISPRLRRDALAGAIGRSIGETAATMSDLREVKFEIEAKIEAINTKIESVQAKLIMWFVGTQIAFVAIVSTLLKL